MIKKGFLFILPLLLLLSPQGSADEGMWLPHQMKDLNLQELGLLMNPEDLYKTDGSGLMSAVVSLGGGTGEFVSPQGLILTNHHVAFGAIQRASDKDHDYITDGFYAAGLDKEIPARGNIADILLGYRDVTDLILKRVRRNATPRQRYDALEKAMKDLIAREEKKGPDLVCTVRSMYSGNSYYLFTFKRIKDIRLVYAPPQALGNFGGEVDNWMWPRHTCDFSFFRAYVSPDNTGVEYNPDNVPYKPTSFLKISRTGVREGDFTFIMGYPGRTYRNNPAVEMKYSFDNLRERIDQSRKLIEFYENAGKNDRGVEILYASRVKGLYNGLKNARGKLEGLERFDILGRVTQKENEFQKWIASNPENQKKYGSILDDLAGYMKSYIDFNNKMESATGLIGRYSPALLSQAYLLYRLAVEKQKPDSAREPGFQERDMPMVQRRVELAERSYEIGTDKRYFLFMLNSMYSDLQSRSPKALASILGEFTPEKLEKYVSGLYERTSLGDPDKRIAMMNMSLKELLAQHDPMIDLAADLEKEVKVLRDEQKEFQQRLLDLKKKYEAGLLEFMNNRMAPDANGTIRFTNGPVKGYSPRDAIWYTSLTFLTGIMEKETGKFPFEVPAKLKQLYREKDFGPYADSKTGDIPTCFLNTTNVTGGNSGSPILNAKGEQVGIIFDMTYESVTGDYYIIPEMQRSIGVDLRFVLFITDKFTGAERLLKEMTIVD